MEENELIPVDNNNAVEYTDDNIRHLSDMEHVRTRPGMYIGRLGDGAHAEDGIYVLLKEVIDNSIDEFKMQAGKKIEITVEENLRVSVRDYGRGIPQGKLIEAVSMLNTGGKYDSKAFKKSVGLNGVGVKAVNALSSRFEVRSYRDGKVRIATFSKGNLLTDETKNTEEENGTYIFFEPDNTLFLNYCFKPEFIETMLRLPDHPPERGRHRNRLHAYRTIRRRILFFRQRSAYYPRWYASKCLQRTHCPYHQRVLQQEHGLHRYP